MKFNRKSLLYSFLILTIYLFISYLTLNRAEIRNPNNLSLINITTNPFAYYDLRTITYVYSVIFLLFINFTLNRSPLFIVRLKNRNSIIKIYFFKITGISFGFVLIHALIGIIS
ncbi:hypothetical protein V7103_08920, partial [Neobacillus drentensis]